jgi:hypothetical protein
MVMKLMKTPMNHNKEYTIDCIRENSLDKISNSFQYPVSRKNGINTRGNSESTSDLRVKKKRFINHSQKTSFIEDYEKELKANILST